MKKILVTGFVPFNGRTVNPAGEIVSRLTVPENTELVRMILPVEYVNTLPALRGAIRETRPDLVLSFGQSGACPALTPEKTAVNFATTRSSDGNTIMKDEAGMVMDDVPLVPGRPAAYFTTLPVRAMCAAAQAAGVRASVSYSAGTYLCNAVMYTALDEAALHFPQMRCGFVHVPFLPEQLEGTQAPGTYPVRYSMALEDMIRGAQAMLDCLAAADGNNCPGST